VEAVTQATVLVESLDNHGRVAWRERIVIDEGRRSFTIGRSVEADVALDDEHAAALHAKVEFAADGSLAVSDMGSRNGLVVAGKRVMGAQSLRLPASELQIGRTRLRIRTSLEPLAPERPDHHGDGSIMRHPMWLAGLGIVAAGLQTLYAGWLGAPRDLTASLLALTATTGVFAAGWIAVWALLTRVMRGEWRWLPHIAICLGAAVAYRAADGLLDLSMFIFSLPRWDMLGGMFAVIALGTALFLHLAHASNLKARHAALIATLVPVFLGGGYAWLSSRFDRLNVNQIEAGMRLYPPSLRMRTAGTVDGFFKSASELRVAADRRRDQMKIEDPERDDDPLPKR
jgi:hypothetical protein